MANDESEFHIIDDEAPRPPKPKRKRKPKSAIKKRSVIALVILALTITFTVGIFMTGVLWGMSSFTSATPPLPPTAFVPSGTLQPANPEADIIARTVYDVAVSPDGRNLVVAYSEGEAHTVLQLRRLRRVASLESDVVEIYNGSTVVSEVAFSGDGRLVAAGFASPNISEVIVWDVATAQQVTILEGHLMAFHPTHPEIATVNYAGQVTRWDMMTFTPLTDFHVPAANVFAMTYSPDGTMLAIGIYSSQTRTPQVVIVSLENEQVLASFSPIDHGLNDMAFSPDSANIAIAIGNYIQLFAIDSGESHLLELSTTTARGVAYQPDGQGLIGVGGAAYWGGDPRIGFWQMDREQPVLNNRIQGHDRDIFEVVFMPDGQYFITVSADGSVRMWNAVTMTEVSRLQI